MKKKETLFVSVKRPIDSFSGNWAGDAGKVVQFDFDSCAKALQLHLMLLVHSTRVFKDAVFS